MNPHDNPRGAKSLPDFKHSPRRLKEVRICWTTVGFRAPPGRAGIGLSPGPLETARCYKLSTLEDCGLYCPKSTGTVMAFNMQQGWSVNCGFEDFNTSWSCWTHKGLEVFLGRGGYICYVCWLSATHDQVLKSLSAKGFFRFFSQLLPILSTFPFPESNLSVQITGVVTG